MKPALLPCPISFNRHAWMNGVCVLCGESRHKYAREHKKKKAAEDKRRFSEK